MLVVSKSHQHFLFDRNLKPAVTIKPGTEVLFETLDACCGEVRTVEQFLNRRKTNRKSNPMTGPVFVEAQNQGILSLSKFARLNLIKMAFSLLDQSEESFNRRSRIGLAIRFGLRKGELFSQMELKCLKILS